MPVYTYHCDNCSHEFDKHQSFSEEALIVCPSCRKHRLRKVYSPARVVFKGSGFYVNDKKRPSSTAKASNTKAKANGKDKTKAAKSKAEGKGDKAPAAKAKSKSS